MPNLVRAADGVADARTGPSALFLKIPPYITAGSGGRVVAVLATMAAALSLRRRLAAGTSRGLPGCCGLLGRRLSSAAVAGDAGGHRLSSRAAALQTGGAGRVWEEVNALASRPGMVNMGQGFPDFEGAAVAREAAATALTLGAPMNQYSPQPGLLQLREEVARFYSRTYGASYEPTDEVRQLVRAEAPQADVC